MFDPSQPEGRLCNNCQNKLLESDWRMAQTPDSEGYNLKCVISLKHFYESIAV